MSKSGLCNYVGKKFYNGPLVVEVCSSFTCADGYSLVDDADMTECKDIVSFLNLVFAFRYGGRGKRVS